MATSLTTFEYKDLDLNFIQHPVKKDIVPKKGDAAIATSIKNLILTNHYERPFQPELGSNIRKLLFEPINSGSAIIMERMIEDVIQNFEPRVSLKAVYVVQNTDENGYDITIEFFINNRATLTRIDFFLERIR